MTFLLGYGVSTAAGRGVEKLWHALTHGQDFGGASDFSKSQIRPTNPVRMCRGFQRSAFPNIKSLLTAELQACLSEALLHAELSVQDLRGKRLGVILASTKGAIEDEVWTSDESWMDQDTIAPVLADFLVQTELDPALTICVSNACASSHAAVYLAQLWLTQKRVDYVLVAACDYIGPFVGAGFATLNSMGYVTPFGANRQGLQLGDGAAVMLLASRSVKAQPRIYHVQIDSEGHAVTRTAAHGNSLEACLKNAAQPDIVVAHGTGTKINDEIENRVFSRVFSQGTPITCTKWSVGHTLAASGSIDMIAATEMLRRQSVFSIANTRERDPSFNCRYLIAGEAANHGELRRVVVTSVGFGGYHGALAVELN